MKPIPHVNPDSQYSGDEEPVKLFTESQLISAVAKKDEEIELLTKERDRAVSRMKAGWIEVCDSGILAFKEMNDELRQQLQAAQEENNHLRMSLADTEALEAGTAETNQKLRDQLATAEQRVAEACYRALDEAYGNEYQLKAIGEYRKYMKGE